MHFLNKLKWRTIAIQIVVLLIIFLLVSAYQQRNVVRGIAPEINASLINGTKISLQQYRGQAVLVHFWATWCPVCNMENSNIQNLSEDYPVLSIAAWSGNAQSVRDYMQKEKLTFPVIADDDGVWAARYGISAVPTSFMLDAEGRVQFVVSGYSTELALRARLWWLEIR